MSGTDGGGNAGGGQNGNGKPTFDLTALATALGFASSLAAWIIVVGGMRVWARFHAAHISASRAVALQPHAYLIAEGLGFLAIPLIFAAVSAVVLYFWGDLKEPLETGRRFLTGLGLLLQGVLVAIPILLLYKLMHDANVGANYVAGIIAVTAGLAWLGYAAAKPKRVKHVAKPELGKTESEDADDPKHMAGPEPGKTESEASDDPRAAVPRRNLRRALALFATVVLYSGGVGFFLVYGETQPRLDTALVRSSKLQNDVLGYLVTDSGGDIYVAKPLMLKTASGRLVKGSNLQIVKVPQSEVTAFSFGPSRRVGDIKALQALRRPLEVTLTKLTPKKPSSTTTASTTPSSKTP